MRRLALALAAGLALPLLAGCPVSPCALPTLEVRWELQNLAGQQNVGCAAAGVSTVNVIVDGVQVVTAAACTAGSATVEALAPGPHRVTVEGRDAGGTLIDRAWDDAVTLAECGTTPATLKPGRGTLFIPYSTTTGSCVLAGDTTGEAAYIWFRLFDPLYPGRDLAAVTPTSSPSDKVFYNCGPYGSDPVTYRPLRFNLPFGVYTLKWIQAVKRPTTTPEVVYQLCTPASVTIDTNVEKSLPVTMAPVTSACTL